MKTVTWDLVAWNRAASALFAYDALALEQRNILRRVFFDPGTKHFRHPVAGVLAVEYSAFSIDGRPDLSLVAYNPAHTEGCEQDLRINKILVQDLTVPATVAEVDGTRWVHFLGRFTNQPSRYC